MTKFGWIGKKHLKIMAAVVFLPLCLLQIGTYGGDVRSKLNLLATARSDALQWNLAQLEVELLRLQDAIVSADRDGIGEVFQVRQRFDIFFSRINTFLESPLYSELGNPEVSANELTEITRYLQSNVKLIDLPDSDLFNTLPKLAAETRSLYPVVRRFTVEGVEHFAKTSDLQREKISRTLSELVLFLFALIAALLFTILILLRLFRKSQSMSDEKDIARTRLEAMVESSLDAILVVDTKGYVLEFNGAAETVFGYTRDEAIGQKMDTLIIPEHLRDMHIKGMERYLSTGKTRVVGAGRVQFNAMGKDGKEFPVEFSTSVAINKGEKVFVSFLRDTSRQVAAENELRQARDDARAGEQARANMLTVMSHEMRTPLNGVLGCVNLLGKTNLTPDQTRYLEAMKVSGELLLQHVNDVLEFARLEASQVELEIDQIDLHSLVETLIESQKAAAKVNGNRLSVTLFNSNLNWVRGDYRRIQQCLLNLIGNAIKFTKNGTVSLEVERLTEGELVEFRVSDTGVGIEAEDLKTIFDDFVVVDTTYSRHTEGTGLGLAITRRLVEAMGGKISAESIQGEGSTFSIQLPLAEVSVTVESLRVADHIQKNAEKKSLEILIVEDNETNRLVVREMLQNCGHSVTEAINGLQGVELAGENTFDLILMDISMPGMDGFEAAHEINTGKGLSRNTPIVALTAHVAREDRNRIEEAGFPAMLTKPVNETELEEILGRACNFPKTHKPPAPLNAATKRFLDDAVLDGFVTHLGLERSLGYIKDFKREIDALLNHLEFADAYGAIEKSAIHRVAGLAAVLGFADIAQFLREMEDQTKNITQSARSNILIDLRSKWVETRAVLAEKFPGSFDENPDFFEN